MTRRTMRRWAYSATFLLVALGPAYVLAEPEKGGSKVTISRGKEVSMEYTLKLDDKQVIDSNVGTAPLTYSQGSNQIIPGLEKELNGLTVGETKEVVVAPADGYGPVDPNKVREVPKEHVPDGIRVGSELYAKDQGGREVRPIVTVIKDKTAVLDFNHPLAGKTLYFDIKIFDRK